MRFASALSTRPETGLAAEEAAARLAEALGGPPDLAVVFLSHHHAEAFDGLGRLLSRRPGGLVLGCAAAGVIDDALEIERGPALVLWGARLPGVRIAPLRFECRQDDGAFTYGGWEGLEDVRDPTGILLLADPFTNLPDLLFEGIAERFGPVPVAGGIASGGMVPGANALFLGERTHRHGTVGVALSGPVRIRPLVSQGCRPIGRHFVVTEARDNVIYRIAGQPALDKFQEIYLSLPSSEQELARRALHVGRVVDEYRDRFGRGDFLIRNCVGFDLDSRAITVNDRVRRGQTIQFHVRDAASASDDLDLLLAEPDGKVEGALLFTCNGRGTRLFKSPHHDAAAVQAAYGPVPLAGFFANGEIGPVAGKTCLHGFTASLALFQQDAP